MDISDSARPGPGHAPVPRGAVIVLTVLTVALGLVTLYSMWTFWPMPGARGTLSTAADQRVSWFTQDFTLNREFLFFLTVALAGALGGLTHTIRSFSWYVGHRDLRWSWVPYNLLLPLVGALGGTVFYLVLRAGLFSPSTSLDEASPFGFAAIAILAGLFSPEAFEKLRVVATEVFAEAPRGAEHVGAKDPPERS